MPKAKALIADDDLFYRNILAECLRENDFEVVLAKSGPEAVAALRQHGELALAILDLYMEEPDGLQVVQNYRDAIDVAGDRDIPFIIMTSDNSKITELKARQQGVTWFILKPFTPSELVKDIKRLITNDIKEEKR